MDTQSRRILNQLKNTHPNHKLTGTLMRIVSLNERIFLKSIKVEKSRKINYGDFVTSVATKLDSESIKTSVFLL